MPVCTVCRGAPLPVWLDCSPEAQADRKRQLAGLMAKLRSGVTSVSDRGRSVGYSNNVAALFPILRQLRTEIMACDLGYWPGRHAISYIDYEKGL